MARAPKIIASSASSGHPYNATWFTFVVKDICETTIGDSAVITYCRPSCGSAKPWSVVEMATAILSPGAASRTTAGKVIV